MKWKNLAAGLNRAEKLEEELRDRWAPSIEELRLRACLASRAARALSNRLLQLQFDEDHAAWQSRQEESARDLEGQRGAWERELSEERQRVMDLARRDLPVFLFVAALLALLGAPTSGFVLAAVAAIVLALGPALLRWRRMAELRCKDPAFWRSEDPEPRIHTGEPEPQVGRRNAVPSSGSGL